MAQVNLPLKFRLQLKFRKWIVSLCHRADDTINRGLLNLFEKNTPPSSTPRNGVVSYDTVISSSENLWFRCYLPEAASQNGEGRKLPLIVNFNGGGFAFFSPRTAFYDAWCIRLAAELNAVVVSVSYRLAPEHRFPTPYEDGFNGLKFLDENLDKLPASVDPRLCFLAGDSAGGNLAHHVAVKAGEYDFTNVKIIGLISIQPFFGGEERTESEIRLSGGLLLSVEDTDWYWKIFLPDGSDRDHPAVNVFGPKSDLDISRVKYPPTLVLIGGLDILCDGQRKYYDGLKKGGKEVYLLEDPDSFHGSNIFDGFPGSSSFMEAIRDFIGKQVIKETSG